MTPRAIWKGYLQLGAVTCPVALYTAASTSDRIVFNTVNRATGHRVRREFVDSETGDPVEKDDQVKGYEAEKDQYIVLEADEIAAAAVKSDKTLDVAAFVAASDIDEAFLDKPYYLAPADRTGDEIFVVLRDGLRDRDAVAVAHAVLFRRLRALLIRPHGAGLIATTLHFDYEVRSAAEVFAASRIYASRRKCWISPGTSSRPSRAPSIPPIIRTVMKPRWRNWSRPSSKAEPSPRPKNRSLARLST